MDSFKEFVEMIVSVCRHPETNCMDCPLIDSFACTHGCDAAELLQKKREIEKWLKKHPAPVYPSWYEYQQQTFPGHSRRICPMAFGVPCPCKSVTSEQACTKCRNNPIPAEIAQKLGIKPKEG